MIDQIQSEPRARSRLEGPAAEVSVEHFCKFVLCDPRSCVGDGDFDGAIGQTTRAEAYGRVSRRVVQRVGQQVVDGDAQQRHIATELVRQMIAVKCDTFRYRFRRGGIDDIARIAGDEVQHAQVTVQAIEREKLVQHVAGVTFRHRELNRNNLMYVVDVLGMPSGHALIDDLQQRKVVKWSTGWDIDGAWVSQNLARERGDGLPQYVGMTGEQPMFSNITYGASLKPATASARDLVSPEFLLYIAIFGLIGAIAAVMMDSNLRGRHWVVQSWLLRVIFWPLLLLSIGNFTLNWAFNATALSTTRILVLLYESMWWLIAAWLIDKAVRRFIWESLEESTQRRVPNVMKLFTSVIVFALSFAAITAFVFNQTLTSLLATSGVLVMVVGLAIQANIANVFSGIILNIERPFKVGDYVKLNNIIGKVLDITWRTTRIESNDGQNVSLANSRVAESLMENFSEVPHGLNTETHFYTRPDADPAQVVPIITDAVAAAKSIIWKDDPLFKPSIRYKGVVNVNGHWVADFEAGYRVAIPPKKSITRDELWTFVRRKFIEQGITLIPADGAGIMLAEAKKA